MSEAQLIFSSEWLKEEASYQKHLDNLHFIMNDKLLEKNGNILIVTTTRDMVTGSRNHWAVDIEHDDSTFFYKDLMNSCPGGLDVYEDVDGFMYAQYTEGDRSSIWKFHFLQDLEFMIDNLVTHLDSYYFEDFRDILEYTLQDGEYLNYNEELAMDLIEDGLEAEFLFYLPYMQGHIIHGILYFDNDTAAWLLQEGTISFDEAFDNYIDECLY